jgi:hypothetical protein
LWTAATATTSSASSRRWNPERVRARVGITDRRLSSEGDSSFIASNGTPNARPRKCLGVATTSLVEPGIHGVEAPKRKREDGSPDEGEAIARRGRDNRRGRGRNRFLRRNE